MGWSHSVLDRGIRGSFDALKKRWGTLFVPLASDLLFLVVFGGILTFYQFYMMEKLNRMQEFLQTGPNLAADLMSQSSVGDILAKQQAFSVLSTEIIKGTILFFSVVYLIYIIFQGLSWYFNYKATNPKNEISYWSYVGQFAYANIFWLAIAGFMAYVGIRITLFNKLSLYPLMQDSTGVGIVIGSIILTLYFMLISYGLIGQHDWKDVLLHAFRLGVKKFYIFLTIDLMIVAIGFIINYVLKWALSIDFKFMVVLGLLILMPLISLLRILHVVVIREIKKG